VKIVAEKVVSVGRVLFLFWGEEKKGKKKEKEK